MIYNFDGGGGGDGPAGWGWYRSDGVVGAGGLPPGSTSNIAEYTALTMAIHDAVLLYRNYGEESFHFKGDSKLVVEQVLGHWKVNADKLRPYVHNVRMLLNGLPEWWLTWVPRKENSKADEQAWRGKTLWTPDTPEFSFAPVLPRGWPEE